MLRMVHGAHADGQLTSGDVADLSVVGWPRSGLRDAFELEDDSGGRESHGRTSRA